MALEDEASTFCVRVSRDGEELYNGEAGLANV